MSSRLASLVDGRLHLDRRRSGWGTEDIGVEQIDDIVVRRQWFRTRLEVHKSDGNRISMRGLGRKEATGLRSDVFQPASGYADRLGPRLEELGRHLDDVLDRKSYFKHSEASKARKTLASGVPECGALVRDRLKPRARTALDRLAAVESAERFEAERSKANQHYVEMSAPKVKETTSSVLPHPLTGEQAEAIATDEDVTLVLAGAGTGKTATIVGKVAHLVRNESVRPDEILVLAYNHKAAKEIRERLPHDLSEAVFTFHAFGKSIIAKSDNASPISKLAVDKRALTNMIENILQEIATDPEQPADVVDFLLYHHRPHRSAFDFTTLFDYEEWVRSVELRTLNGELVKSFEELVIANYLAEHGIRYEYESDYPVDTATRSHRQYQPDFYLPDHRIFVEHFALDEQMRPPAHWEGYAEGVTWKRNLHIEHETTLVETYSWQYRKDVLLHSLRQTLEDQGVKFEPVPRQELLEKLTGQSVSRLAQLLDTFLNHVKTSDLTSDQLRKRARLHQDSPRCLSFLRLFEAVRKRYEQVLDDEQAVDFHDLINRATAQLREEGEYPGFRYVLVDEFQDISRGRMALLQALARFDVAWFLVGDDWQSIYRFAGSDVGLVRNCQAYLGYTTERTLSQTFRFGRGILDPSTAFVRRNPEQTRRPLRSSSSGDDTGISVIFESDTTHGIRQALDQIKTHAKGERRSVLVLGRYRSSRKALRPLRPPGQLKVQFSTAHSAKGKEADYVVVVDLKDGRMGFPCRVDDDPLLDLVLPPCAERRSRSPRIGASSMWR